MLPTPPRFGAGLPAADTLQQLAEQTLARARAHGADHAVVRVSQQHRRALLVRQGDIDTLTQNHSQRLSVTVYVGQRAGSVTTTLFSPDAVNRAVASACTLAQYGDDDPHSGLPTPAHLATEVRDLALYDAASPGMDEALTLARRAEQAINDASPGRCYSESVEIESLHSQFILANSHGFCAGYPTSLHTLWCLALAKNGLERQQGFRHDSQRSPLRFAAPETLGRLTAERAVAQLGARKLTTQRCPVLFEAPVAHSLILHLVSALNGHALYLSNSFLGLCRGETIAASHLSLREDPFQPGALASASFDAEGVAGSVRDIVSRGVAQDYFLDSYSARRLGMVTTGNAGGAYNLTVSSDATRPEDSLSALVKKMHRGLLVTALLGEGLNPMTGDYSQGVSGFWVEHGEIQYPVAEITIAGNLKHLLLNCVALGADAYTQDKLTCGSLLFDNMQLAGQ
ncbi:metallopeptidase TldD-related protein [Dickeya fangzhongdai]|uniref:TldD/PmbA family protein n=1 Tax=Dickeya fangzhongdai TaxID=1778540 RepID=UPI002B2C9527|nr:metallopeptidase TldD-related protein [Dickeya fangzhongdai]